MFHGMGECIESPPLDMKMSNVLGSLVGLTITVLVLNQFLIGFL